MPLLTPHVTPHGSDDVLGGKLGIGSSNAVAVPFLKVFNCRVDLASGLMVLKPKTRTFNFVEKCGFEL